MTEISRRNLLAATGALAAAGLAPASLAAESQGLKGKAVFITGTSSGFGRLGALLYARAGARVFATMRNLPRPEAADLRQVAAHEQLDLHVLALDVRSDEQVAAAVAEAERIHGGAMDVVVNNAGIYVAGPVELQDMEAARLAFDTNVLGVHRVLRAVLPKMRAARRGWIVNVSSQAGRVIMPGGGLYSATKFALEALSEQLAYELVPHGIEVTIIEPGGFPTNVGANRARYNAELLARADEDRKAAYPALVRFMTPPPAANPAAPRPAGLPDPIEVPNAILELALLPAGSRPLRRPVHPSQRPQEAINAVSAETQRRLLGSGPYKDWAAAVLD